MPVRVGVDVDVVEALVHRHCCCACLLSLNFYFSEYPFLGSRGLSSSWAVDLLPCLVVSFLVLGYEAVPPVIAFHLLCRRLFVAVQLF